jgi:tetratricopeptide (TPR) repeat protein
MVLAVARNATPEQIRARFRSLARARHPDRFQGEQRVRAEAEFLEITEAFNVLSNPERRRQHDLDLARPRGDHGGSESSSLARFHAEAAAAFSRDGNPFAAAESYERVVQLEPRNHQAWHGLAQALAHQRKLLPRALAASSRACALDPVNPVYLELAGRLHRDAGVLDKAERYYNEALTWGGEDPAVLRALEELRARGRKGRSAPSGRDS